MSVTCAILRARQYVVTCTCLLTWANALLLPMTGTYLLQGMYQTVQKLILHIPLSCKVELSSLSQQTVFSFPCEFLHRPNPKLELGADCHLAPRLCGVTQLHFLQQHAWTTSCLASTSPVSRNTCKGSKLTLYKYMLGLHITCTFLTCSLISMQSVRQQQSLSQSEILLSKH